MATNLPKNVSRFVPAHQQLIIADPDCYDDFKEIIERLDKEIVEIPDYPQKQSEVPGSMHDRLTVYAHFFYADCDWFIIDWDREDDILFCYAIIGGDVEMSELVTTFLSDLTSHGRVELDFYWKKRTLAQALYDKYPSYFPKP